ncbi:MAG: hypothetical protein NT027_06350 [Proteobacteria bacterium]|nr:hypothetical protein [Pseudomonadota bacterium]
MGLQEKRVIKEFQDNQFPALKSQIMAAAKVEIPMEVSWDQMALDGWVEGLKSNIAPIYFEPLVKAFSSLCADDMGSDAVKAAVKSIKICNTDRKYGEDAISFANGVLQIDHCPVSNPDNVQERADFIVSTLEKIL